METMPILPVTLTYDATQLVGTRGQLFVTYNTLSRRTCMLIHVHSSGTVGLWDCGTVGLWDCGTVGLWDCGTVVLWDGTSKS